MLLLMLIYKEWCHYALYREYTQQPCNKRDQVGDQHAGSSGRCKMYITTCSVLSATSWTLAPLPLPENSPDLNDLERWLLRSLNIQNSVVIHKTFTHAIKVDWLNNCVVVCYLNQLAVNKHSLSLLSYFRFVTSVFHQTSFIG